MFDSLVQYSEEGFRILAAVVGLIFIVHGYSKIKDPASIAQVYGAPKFIGLVHGLVEVLGGLMLIVYWHPKTAALLLGLIMVGAIYYKIAKWKVPFMAMDKTGWEFDLLLLAVCISIIVR